jgi:hypothetical protein
MSFNFHVEGGSLYFGGTEAAILRKLEKLQNTNV